MTVALALLAALLTATAWVLQYHEAHEAPKRLFLSPRLLVELAHHRIWLAGLLAMAVGGGVQAAALGSGSLAVVEPVLTTSLLFAMALSAAWRRERVPSGDWVAAVMVCAGLATLLVVGAPTPGHSTMSPLAWALTTGSAWTLATLLVVIGRRQDPAPQAGLVAGGASVLFGLQDALTRYCLEALHGGLASLLTTWQPYVLAVTAIYALTLMQSAYEAGPLAAALPPLAIGEPIAGALIGTVAFDEQLRTAGLDPLWEALAAALMVGGSVLLARSPLVLGRHGHRHAPATGRPVLSGVTRAVAVPPAQPVPAPAVSPRPARARRAP